MTDTTAKTDRDTDLLETAREQFKRCVERERDNRQAAEEDIRFARLDDQWPAEMKAQRTREGRPCLTINTLAPIIRQVVNDARQNKPSIKVLPQDSKADPATAEVYSGLIRNIEASSDADVAYDTAIDNAVTGGFGYFRIGLKYACDDNWEQDVVIERIPDPLSVYGDPDSTHHDSSDWNVCFVAESMSKAAFEKRFDRGKDSPRPVDWSLMDRLDGGWCEGDQVRVAEWWTREQVTKQLTLLSDGSSALLEDYEAKAADYQARGVVPVGKPRPVMSYKVTQRLITGAEVLETVEWAGKFIPVVPVYGDEVIVGGKRHLRSLIRSAKDEQRRFNYWTTQATELVALAPKAPFMGRKGAFEADEAKWETINTATHAFVEYEGEKPERMAPPPIPAGMLQEALGASDNIKRITGVHDASLGMRSNETSGRAILARQREGDVSTFHFIDNLSRAIRHAGRILIDLIPKVYSTERMVRVLGEDGTPQTVPVGPSPQPGQPGAQVPQGFDRVYDLGLGKYDLSVVAGPGFTTRREEAAVQMTEFIRAYPAAAPIIGDLLAKNLDWPGADEMAKRLQAMLPPQVKGEQPPDPEKVQMAQVIQQGTAEFQKLQQQYAELAADRDAEAEKLRIDAYKAQTDRLKVRAELAQSASVFDPAY